MTDEGLPQRHLAHLNGGKFDQHDIILPELMPTLAYCNADLSTTYYDLKTTYTDYMTHSWFSTEHGIYHHREPRT